ncbi:MAG TPA: hypothetical protein PLZ52_03220 [Bacteroidales bacterium]|nr:hypothetical protein [Bacteroidales bacterium]
MIIKFRLISPEEENFVRDIEISGDDSFLDLHEAIQAACDYDPSMLTAFYVSNNHWDKGQEIVLQIMDEDEQKDSLLMDETIISSFYSKKGEKLIYIYDFFSVRHFLLEVVNVRQADAADANLSYPICTLCSGIAPQQIKVDEISAAGYSDDLSDEFDELDLDEEDFENFDSIDNYDL